MEAELVLKKLESVRDLPTLPLILEKLRITIADVNSDAKRIAKIIEDDPAMMARIMKVVNSALYGTRDRITSLQLAIARLGFRAINNIAISTSVFAAFRATEASLFNRVEFWRHSVSTGIASAAVLDTCRGNLNFRYEKELLHLAGLVHDIGKIVLDMYFNDLFSQAIEMSRSEKIPLYKAEKQVIGIDHGAVGAWLARKWKMADNIVAVLEYHHNVNAAPPKYQELVMICDVANYICNFRLIGDAGDTAKPECSASTWRALKLGEKDYYAIMNQIVQDSAKSEVLMSFL